MNHKHFFRTALAGLIALLMLLTAIGCSNTPGQTTGTTDTAGDTTDAPETELKQSNVEAVDYNGYGFVFADTELESGSRYIHRFNEIFGDSTSSDPVDLAVYKRNSIIQEKYNVELISNIEINVYNSLKAHEQIMDAMIKGPYEVKSAMQEGLRYYRNSADNFNFEESWWMKSIADAISFGDRIFQMPCDANIRALASGNVIFFNKVVLEDYCKGTNLYSMVDNNEWTLEVMETLSKQVSDGGVNGVFDENGRYGSAINNFGIIALYYASDCRFLTKDEDGELVGEFGSDRQITVLSKIVEYLNDPTINFYSEKYKDLYDNARSLLTQEMFEDNRTLFVCDLLGRGNLMRTVESEYGILPVPKFDSTQEKYITYLHGNSSFMSIPFNVIDIDCSSRILEDMAFYSTDTVREAYIEILVKSKIMQEDEDAKRMVDLIYSNITFDMGYFGIGSMDADLRSMADKNDTNFTSFFDEKAGMWNRLLTTYLRPFMETE